MYILASGYIHLYFSKFLGVLQPNFTFEAIGKILLNKNVAMLILTYVKTVNKCQHAVKKPSWAQIATCRDWKLRRNVKLQCPNCLRRSDIACVVLWHAPGGNFSNYVTRHRYSSLLPYHNYPALSTHNGTKKYKLSKLLQNNYIHLLGNIPYYFSLYFLWYISAQTKV